MDVTAPSPPDHKSRTLIPQSLSPVFLTTTAAQTYRHVHPILTLTLLYLAFPSLLANPDSTLLATAPILALLQFLYCVFCLPPYSNAPPPKPTEPRKPKDTTTTTTPRPPKRVQFAQPPSTLSTKIIPALLSLLLPLPLTPPLTVLLILHGAPLTTSIPSTTLLALHLSLLLFPPLLYVHGTSSRIWREILTFNLPLDEMWGGVVGGLVGAWLGQVVLPLDWDRAWQRWPLPILVGGYLGWVVGRLGGEWSLLKGRRIQFGNEEGRVDGE